MLTKNLNINVGLVNGCIGEVIDFVQIIEKDSVDSIDYVIVNFDNYCGDRIILEGHNKLVPIQKEESSNGTFNFPLVAADAMTIHKSQGSTFNFSTYVDIGDREVLGSSFVAFSRVTTIENLYLKPFEFERFKKIGEVAYSDDRKRALELLEEIEFELEDN